MRLLFIITYNKFESYYTDGIHNLKNYIHEHLTTHQVDIACINSNGDFNDIENILPLKYKITNPKYQMDKICDFINSHLLDYDWFIKTRPEMLILAPIDFSKLIPNAINARARTYTGSLKIENGASVGGEGVSDVDVRDKKDIPFDLVMDDQIFIFDKNVILNNGFAKIGDDEKQDFYSILPHHPKIQHEWFHTYIWAIRNIRMNIIGIKACFKRNAHHGYYSGDIC
jgi:hypothetical protein